MKTLIFLLVVTSIVVFFFWTSPSKIGCEQGRKWEEKIGPRGEKYWLPVDNKVKTKPTVK